VGSSTWTQKAGFWLRHIFRIAAYGLCLGVAINIPFIGIDLYHYHHLSRADLFDRLQPGMPADQATKLLERAGIPCVPREDSGSTCDFADFWRGYNVHLDFARNRVEFKTYYFRRRSLILVRLGLMKKPQTFD
jgi:hypothetical protein